LQLSTEAWKSTGYYLSHTSTHTLKKQATTNQTHQKPVRSSHATPQRFGLIAWINSPFFIESTSWWYAEDNYGQKVFTHKSHDKKWSDNSLTLTWSQRLVASFLLSAEGLISEANEDKTTWLWMGWEDDRQLQISRIFHYLSHRFTGQQLRTKGLCLGNPWAPMAEQWSCRQVVAANVQVQSHARCHEAMHTGIGGKLERQCRLYLPALDRLSEKWLGHNDLTQSCANQTTKNTLPLRHQPAVTGAVHILSWAAWFYCPFSSALVPNRVNLTRLFQKCIWQSQKTSRTLDNNADRPYWNKAKKMHCRIGQKKKRGTKITPDRMTRPHRPKRVLTSTM